MPTPEKKNPQRDSDGERSGNSKATANGREVTDPITHFPVTIHDNTSIELEQIPPSRSDSKATEDMTAEETDQQQHTEMERVVWEETNKGWWEEPNHNRTRTALVVAISVSIGGYTTLIISKILPRICTRSTSGEGFGILDIYIGVVAYTLLAIAAGFLVLRYETKGENNNNQQEVSCRILLRIL